MSSWPEIQTVIDENRRELVIKGSPEIVERFEKNEGKIPDSVYGLSMLNFLEIARCDVTLVSPSINKLSHLAQLLLNNNKIDKIPDEITDCLNLKLLDVSYNLLTELPENLGKLQNLQTINASNNKIGSLPESFSNLAALSVVNLSSNSFDEFPMCLLSGGASAHISDLNISHNEIEFLPDEAGNLTSMKQFDISDNKVKDLPQTISKILKLKQANYKANPLKDRRLKKLIETNNSQKSIMDYIRSKGRKPETSKATNGDGQKTQNKVTKRQQKKNTLEDENKIDVVRFKMQVLKLNDEEEDDEDNSTKQQLPHIIIVTEAVKDVRPYLVACVLKNINLTESKFKIFLSIQTDLHEHLCSKRTVATIATHDAKYFCGAEIFYDARPPSVISILPLGRVKPVSATRLFRSLKKEAEETRKQKKRNQPTGIHKYLSLLEDKELFPFLYTKTEEKSTVVSLPPLTNAEESKITTETKDVFVEITSSKSLQDCKNVMDTLLTRMVESGIYSQAAKDFYADSSDEEAEAKPEDKTLLIHQVKVVDITGKLKVLYPSKTDLNFDKELGIQVIRPY